ncbi:MAG: hypothetical protein ACTSUE_07975 [Promethearchaeota archaeon]
MERNPAKEFIISPLLSVKLEDGVTHVYVKGKRFIQCMRLVLTISLEDQDARMVESIDEATEKFGTVYEGRGVEEEVAHVYIDPETEFMGHCSNLQAWYEHDYDTRLLAMNIAFPLLKELANRGDKKAKRVARSEILSRLRSGHPSVVKFLLVHVIKKSKWKNYWDELGEIMDGLASSEYEETRSWVASSDFTSLETLVKLTNDPNQFIQLGALSTLDRRAEKGNIEAKEICQKLYKRFWDKTKEMKKSIEARLSAQYGALP